MLPDDLMLLCPSNQVYFRYLAVYFDMNFDTWRPSNEQVLEIETNN